MRLSPSALNLFKDCPRCFWLEKNKNIKRPRGIFPSLPGGMDRVLKEYVDNMRLKQDRFLVPGYEDLELFTDLTRLNKWRSWRATDLVFTYDREGVELSGAIDDLLYDPGKDLFVPLDFKTRGSVPKKGDSEKYYGVQISAYGAMLTAAGLKVADYGLLMYYFPAEAMPGGMVSFSIEVVKVPLKCVDVVDLLDRAVCCAIQYDMPAPSEECEYCGWIKDLKAGGAI